MKLEVLDAQNCVFGEEAAAAVFYMSKGCACKPDKIQALCPQHIIKSEPIGSMEMIFDWGRDVYG